MVCGDGRTSFVLSYCFYSVVPCAPSSTFLLYWCFLRVICGNAIAAGQKTYCSVMLTCTKLIFQLWENIETVAAYLSFVTAIATDVFDSSVTCCP